MSKKAEIAKFILGAIAVVGIVAIAVAMPNLFMVLGQLNHRTNGKKKFTNKQLYGSFYNLKRTGLITMKQEGDKTVIKLTKNGREKVLKFKLEDMRINRPKRWDKKWRLVIFDIPEKYKKNRDALTSKLKELGFVQLQRSVWVCPYECEDEIDFVKEMYELRSFVRIVTAEKLDLQDDLVKKFKLV